MGDIKNNKSLEDLEVEILYWNDVLERMGEEIEMEGVFGTTFTLSRAEVKRILVGFSDDYEIFKRLGKRHYTGRVRVKRS